MKKLSLLSLLFLFIHVNVFGQLHYITGVVKDETGIALPGVEVFLSGTSKLTLTDENGEFNISRLTSGNYELVAKLLGRESYRAIFTLSRSSKFNITLKFSSRQLAEVPIKPSAYNSHEYKFFERIFIGETPNAAHCKILNPQILNLFTDPETKTLHVNSGGEFLVIQNSALGYTLKYILDEFVLDQKQGYMYYSGQAVFNEMGGTVLKKEKWRQARLKAYLGSPQHFLNSIYHDNIKKEGFIIRKIHLKQNEDLLSEKDFVIKQDSLNKKLAAKIITKQEYNEALEFFERKANLPQYIQTVRNDTLNSSALIKHNIAANKQLGFFDGILITYLPEKPAPQYHSGISVKGMSKLDYRLQGSTVTMREDIPVIDATGNLANPLSLIFNGYMGWERVADMLPKDYVYDSSENKSIEIKKEP